MPWKAPKRPPVKISQCYNDGIANVFAVSDTAQPGYQPVETLTPKISLRYEERRLGIKRYYAAAQNQIRVERVIRVPHAGEVTSQDVVIDEKGRQYRIDLVQLVPDAYPLSDDLTLVRIKQGTAGSEGTDCHTGDTVTGSQ
ncbi:MAG: phage head closure protein [Oscillospiraceae bacterium]|nr:phage head closure protein [Oscillospiraceae bacterium]MBR4548593.1 phage head closure protein [Oscillospiraceae bacterium]